MKKKIFTIIIVALILVIISVTIIFALKHDKSENIITANSSAEVNWKALYIWDGNLDLNYWLCFRKKINIKDEVDIESAVANITVDSKYWLYINDELVIRDGSLKRGRTPTSIYYDQVEIGKYLNEGENTIAILACHWGKDSYSHTSKAHKGLLFQAEIGDQTIISDESWKVSKNKAFSSETFCPNYRLPEYNTLYDARLAEEDWYKKDFDDSTWTNAQIVEAEGCELIPRDIPFFKYSEIEEYSNMTDYVDYTTKKTETIEMEIPYSMQFTPYLKVEAEAGKTIKITTDTYMIDGAAVSLSASYITKSGVQEYEAYTWISGEKAYYEIPAGVKIISLGYRETGYDTELVGSFETDDEFLNKLWKKAQRTLYINMRDSYMDCPDRERAQWSLDMNLEMQQAMYALDPNANDLYEHGIRTILGWREENALLSVVPNTNDPIQLPVQTLLTIEGMYQYYLYTGNIEFLREIYPYVEQYLELWHKNTYGVLEYTSYYYVWEWKDGSDSSDYKLLEIMSYYFAKSSVYKMAETLGYIENREKLKSDLEDIEIFLNDYWTDKGYKSANEDVANCRVNALAVLSGLATEEKYPVIAKVLKENYDTGPAMEKYVLEALCILDEHESAIARMKERYTDMVNYDKSTIWEHWGVENGGKNHAWSGGPLTIMSKYFAGIEPLKAGYETISIKPNLAGLNKLSSKVSTVRGEIDLEIEKSDSDISMNLEIPAEAIIAIPKEYSNIKINKEDILKYEYHNEDEKYIYYNIPKGKYNIDCKIK